ncbi:MAG: filamentous hemagglutinin N-terminal domain-containing protein [Oscillatoria sp. SIO1A7]|nr:filamentous hemagglutinin N-terminal domain-containing protein [Oscillatoria sp. SIO1A7]
MKPSHPNYPKKHWLVFLSCLLAVGYWMSPEKTSAQIVPDSTLPINSTVTPNGNTLLIEGGTPIGGNLFHSFQEFSVPTGGEAYFNNSLTIENILTRVTGGSISNIDGVLRANSGANLFLLNPNGIVFGPNAALNIGGSFFASTADSLRLSDGSDFSATSPNPPPMLTINVPLGLQLGASPGKIINQSRASNSNGNTVGLSVQPGETIGLVGGDISIEGGAIDAPVGKIELISLTDGFWEFGQEQNSSLESVPIGNSQFGNIELTRESNVSTSGVGGGSIDIVAGKLSVRDGSQLVGITSGDQAGGPLRINAARSVEVIGNSADGLVPSQISTETQGAGAGGDLTIATGRLLLAEGGFLSASTFGAGDGGNISVRASESVELMGTGFEDFERDSIGRFLSADLTLSERVTGIFTGTEGTGDSGDIAVETPSFRAQDGTLVFTPSFAEGTGGSINVRASEAIELSGSVFGASNLDAGSAGNIEVDTARLLLRDGAFLGNTTLGSGRGGNVTVRATESIELRSRPTNAIVGTGIVANSINSHAPAGKVSINTRSLIIEDGAVVSTSSGFFSGDETIRNGGTGGDLLVRASEKVELSGISPDGKFPSALRSATFTDADSGNLTIETGSLIVRDGAEVSTLAEGIGRGGNLSITAEEVVRVRGSAVSRAADNGRFLSQLVSDARGAGAGGNLTIHADRLQVIDRGLVSASSFGTGQGGDLTIVAKGNVELVGIGFAEMQRVIIDNFVNKTLRLSDRVTGLFTGTEIAGAAGDITIDAKDIVINDGAIISAAAFDEGTGGRLNVRAEEVEMIGGGMSASTSGIGRAGDIQIDVARLVLRDGALLGNATSDSGTAGNVVAIASELVEVSSTPPGASVPTGIVSDALDGSGSAGSVEINTPQFIARDRAQLNAGSIGSGSAGTLTIVADFILLDRRTNLMAATASGFGGNIVLQAPNIQLRRRSIISTNARNSNGGNITIDTNTLAALENSDISANAQTGFGGRVSINAEGIFGTEFQERRTRNSDITATSQLGPQFRGVVEINTPEVDPGAGLIKLPETVVDITGLVARDPCNQEEQSEFIMTGRGGLPPSPFDPLSNPVMAIEWATRENGASSDSSIDSKPINSRPINSRPINSRRIIDRSFPTVSSAGGQSSESGSFLERQETRQIVEATGWRIDENGDVILTAGSPGSAPYSPALTPPNCREEH